MRRVALIAALAAGIAWLWWPSEERRIRARLDELAAAATGVDNESNLDRIARLAVLTRGLTREAQLDLGAGRPPITGREAVAALASRPTPAGGWTVRLEDVRVVLADARVAATVDATVLFEEVVGPGRPWPDAREVRFEMRQVDGVWLVDRAAVIDAVERPR